MEIAMQPYEIRQFRDGSIDYNSYYARPVSVLSPGMRRIGRPARALAVILVVIAGVTAAMIAASAASQCSPCALCKVPAAIAPLD
jgi:hypothetical protein